MGMKLLTRLGLSRLGLRLGQLPRWMWIGEKALEAMLTMTVAAWWVLVLRSSDLFNQSLVRTGVCVTREEIKGEPSLI